MARRLRKRCGQTPAEAIWRGACVRALTRRLRKRYDPSSTEALCRSVCGSAMT